MRLRVKVVNSSWRVLLFSTVASLFFFAATPFLSAAVNTILWKVRASIGSLGDVPWRADTDSRGYYYVGGTFADMDGSSQVLKYSAFLRKHGPKGGIRWTRKFAVDDFTYIMGVAVDKRHDWVYVVGTTAGALPNQKTSGNLDVFIRKYSSRGGIYWTRQFGGPGVDLGFDVAVGPGGNVLVTGSSQEKPVSFSSLDLGDAILRKFSPKGELLWARRSGTEGFDAGTSVAVDRRGQIFVGGATGGTFPGQQSAGDADAFLHKYSASGRPLWTHQFGRPSFDYVTEVVAGNRGNIYVVGSVGPRGFARKYTPGGKRLWTRLWSDHLAMGAAIDSERNLYVVGSRRISTVEPKANVRKYTTIGRKLWAQDVAVGMATGAAVTERGELFVSGMSQTEVPQNFQDLIGGLGTASSEIFVTKLAR